MFPSIECLDLSLATLKWVTLEQRLSCRRSGCAVVAVGKLIYIIGGCNGTSRLSSVEAFDTKSGLIHQDQPSMTTEHHGCAAALVGNKIWVVGGQNQDGKTLNTIEYLEVNLDNRMPAGRWTTSTINIAMERCGLVMTTVCHCLVIMGGDKDGEELSSVEIFDTECSVCYSLPDMIVPRFVCAAVTLGESNIVVLGGYGIGGIDCSVESLALELKGVQTCYDLSQSKCITSLTMNNIKTFVTWAYLLDANNLLNACLKFINDNAKAFLCDMDFLKLLEEERELWEGYIINALRNN